MDEWLSERLGLAVVWEDASGQVVGNARCHALLAGAAAPTLSALVSSVLGAAPVVGDVDAHDIEAHLERARAGEPVELRDEGGHPVWLLQHAPGRAKLVVAARAAAPQLDRSDLAAGVSHELANALAAIAGWARLAKQGRRVQEALGLIQMSAESAWSAAQRLLRDLRGESETGFESVDLSSFVDEAARLLGPKAMAKHVQVRTVIEPGIHVPCNRGSAWSIVWNLALNAVEALSPGGCVELRLGVHGDTAVLVVEDDGPGMDTQQQQRAFEPYFTTKASGNGLGLAMVSRAVGELGGSVELRSALGQGTRFTVALPRVLGPVQKLSEAHESGVFHAEPIERRILVVEDDLGLREMISTALSMRGAEVTAVDGPEAALAQRMPFSLAIIDLLLPGMRGDALLARLREARLVERGMLMTGTELPAGISEGGEPDVLLRKPFELEELFEGAAAAVAEQLARRVG